MVTDTRTKNTTGWDLKHHWKKTKTEVTDTRTESPRHKTSLERKNDDNDEEEMRRHTHITAHLVSAVIRIERERERERERVPWSMMMIHLTHCYHAVGMSLCSFGGQWWKSTHKPKRRRKRSWDSTNQTTHTKCTSVITLLWYQQPRLESSKSARLLLNHLTYYPLRMSLFWKGEGLDDNDGLFELIV